jgi:hypothetical protein
MGWMGKSAKSCRGRRRGEQACERGVSLDCNSEVSAGLIASFRKGYTHLGDITDEGGEESTEALR